MKVTGSNNDGDDFIKDLIALDFDDDNLRVIMKVPSNVMDDTPEVIRDFILGRLDQFREDVVSFL